MTLLSKKKILVVLPTYNEFENIPLVLQRIINVVKCDVLFVDDGSTDGSLELIKDLVKVNPNIKALFRGQKKGLGSAYREAYAYAIKQNYDYLIQCDTDGSHEIEKIPEFIDAADDGADLVIGSRYVPGGSILGWAKSRQIISKTGNLYSRIMLGLKTKDNTAGYRLYNLHKLAKVNFNKATANGYAFQVQMTYLLKNHRTVEVPIQFVERKYGKSKMTANVALEALVKIPLLRFK